MSLWATKSVTALRAEAEATGERSLKRALGAMNLTMLGIGAIIGAGIFVLTGLAAALHAGPGVMLSFIVAAIACGLAGLCYAEMASTVPVAGSAYTYSYATMGEFVAWIIGWDLVLEYAMGAATVGVGWSGYLVSLLDYFGLHLPAVVTSAPLRWCSRVMSPMRWPPASSRAGTAPGRCSTFRPRSSFSLPPGFWWSASRNRPRSTT